MSANWSGWRDLIQEYRLARGEARASTGKKKPQRLQVVKLDEGKQSFYLRELARLTGISAGTTQRDLRDLERVGLVRSERRGRQIFYQANRLSPVFDALRALLEQTMGAPDLVRAALAGLADKIIYAGVYGSLAEGTLKPSSDIDVLVVGKVEFSEVTDSLAPTEQRLGRPVNPTVYTSAEFHRGLKDQRHFLTTILGRPLIDLIGVLPLTLAQWNENGWLQAIPVSAEEVGRLLAVADRSLADAGVAGVSVDARLGFAHAATVAVAAAALASEGYRAGKERHHEGLLDSLRYTIGVDLRLLKQLRDVGRGCRGLASHRG